MRWGTLALTKPYYVFRPSQLFRRLLRSGGLKPGGGEFETVVLPWGLEIRFRPGEMIGASIARTGLYDLWVSETIHRLLEPRELAVDVGANIGHMTSIMAVRVGQQGRVIAFEPQPEVFAELSHNVNRWKGQSGIGQIQVYEIALSDHSGRGSLRTPEGFQQNRGTASLVTAHQAPDGNSTLHEVSLERLDELLGPEDRIGLLKLDVEGHEIHVLRGATGLLGTGRIRDIIFEEHAPYPTETTRCLEDAGYTLFRLTQAFWGPTVSPVSAAPARPGWEPPNFLATAEPSRALSRLQPRGWQALGR